MDRRKCCQTLLLALGACLFGASAHAEGMSCGTKLVSEGRSTMYDVQALCGAPDATVHRIEYRTVRAWVAGPCVRRQGAVQCGYATERLVEVSVDEWTYDFGRHQFIRTLVFEEGTLLAIKTGGYGHKLR